jgi:hypothetical protein
VYSAMIESSGSRAIYVDLKAIKKRPYKDLELQSYDVVTVRGKGGRVQGQAVNPCPSIVPDSMMRNGVKR